MKLLKRLALACLILSATYSLGLMASNVHTFYQLEYNSAQ